MPAGNSSGLARGCPPIAAETAALHLYGRFVAFGDHGGKTQARNKDAFGVPPLGGRAGEIMPRKRGTPNGFRAVAIQG